MTMAALETKPRRNPDKPPGWTPSIPAAAIGRVIQKLADGTYPTETVRCVCGADFNDVVLAERDRFFMPHRMVLCNECCLMRATPRMTQAAYHAYYNDEYRTIYDGWEFGQRYGDTEYVFMRQANHGVKFKEFTDHFGIVPKSVLEVGCHMGGMLQPFAEAGAEVFGVDLCRDSIAFGQAKGIPLQTGTIDDLIAQGRTADLVVMQDFIEHLLDLTEIGKFRQLLNPGGYLFIATPGLFRWNLATIFQNAHPYLFIGATLQYLMGQYGFEDVYLDEEITSLWQSRPDQVCHLPKPVMWKKYIGEHFAQVEWRSMPPPRTINKFPVPKLQGNLKANLAQQRPDLSALTQTRSGSAVIIGGGPSVDGQLDTIKAKIADGAALIAIERMYPWCATHGLHPDFVMSMDCSDGVEDGFTHIQDGTIHVLSTVTHPTLFALLADKPVYVFNSPQAKEMDVGILGREAGYQKLTILNTGGSVTLGCMSLACTLGYTDLQVFGFDCMVEEDKAYASGIAGESVERHYFPVEIDGTQYFTCASFLGFARSFFHFKGEALTRGLLKTLTVHGESLVNKMVESEQVSA